jgi:hypothetical protein
VLPPPEDVLRALLPLDDLDEELLPRDDAAEERRLDALELFGLLPELEALLRLEALLPFEDVLRVLLRDPLLLGLDPFELREVFFFCDCELAWAMSPP